MHFAASAEIFRRVHYRFCAEQCLVFHKLRAIPVRVTSELFLVDFERVSLVSHWARSTSMRRYQTKQAKHESLGVDLVAVIEHKHGAVRSASRGQSLKKELVAFRLLASLA